MKNFYPFLFVNLWTGKSSLLFGSIVQALKILRSFLWLGDVARLHLRWFLTCRKSREESIVIRPLEKASKAITCNDVMTQLCHFLTELIARRRILNYVRTGRSQATSNYSSLDCPTNK